MKKTPAGWERITPTVFYDDAAKAIDWLCRVFGFEVRLKVEGEGGRIEHSELTFGDGMIMAAAAGGKSSRPVPLPCASPRTLGGVNTQSLAVFVDDADAHCAQARAAGAKIIEEPVTTDYGQEYWSDRTYRSEDLEGHQWWFIERVRDGSKSAEVERRRLGGDVVTMQPIGIIRGPHKDASAIPKGLGARHTAEGTIDLRAELEEGLLDIEGFSHLLIIWVFDRSEGYELTGRPPSDDRPHGVFATRSPYRPNPLGLTVVELLRREGSRLHVRGIDMLDGTPVLDIKPYLSSVPEETLKRGWLDEAEARRAKSS
ncbi:MAG TPA: tRNA (N6-threonylcarbamoyladenosine(37)-N6)-methyltransferase TrmO [Thermoanaerobaculia bacterium]|nr:tRNA (N6-threonylcarbamoyladenosine(37)-N6)-methyltransferase TrmO [Thermoanaerobaculia bacterium]